MKHLTLALALAGCGVVQSAAATECSDTPRFFTGTATAYAPAGVRIRDLALEVIVERLSENQCQTTTTITAVDDPETTETLVCVETELTEAGASRVTCDDGSYGTKVDIGSNSARRLFQPDGSVNVSGSAVDDGGERRRNITTRIGADGELLGYIRERLMEVEGEG